MSLEFFKKTTSTPPVRTPATPATPATPPARTYSEADVRRLIDEAEARGRAAATPATHAPAAPASSLSDADVRRIAAALRGSEAPATPAAPAAPATPATPATGRPATTPAPVANPADAPMTIGAFETWQRANRFEAQAHATDPARADKADRIQAVVDSRLNGMLKWFDGTTERRTILTWKDCWEAATASSSVTINGHSVTLLLAENGNGSSYEMTRWRRGRGSLGLAYDTVEGDLAWCPSTNEKKCIPILLALIAALP